MSLSRRDTLILAASASLASVYGLMPAMAQDGTMRDVAKLSDVALPDKAIGSPDAPVTVIEYASPTCPHCAAFHNDVYPAFKTAYIDTGKVRFVLRPFVRNVLDAVVFMLAEAGGEEQYHAIVETYFRTQSEWGVSQTPRDALLAVAQQIGFTEASFDAALTNQPLFDAMETMREQALADFGLSGTPTFYVNGKQLTGDKTLEQLAAEIDPLVPADFQPIVAESDAPAPADAGAMAPADAGAMAPADAGAMAPADAGAMAPADAAKTQ